MSEQKHRRITGRLVIATHNPGKLAEMRELLAPYGIDAISAGELGLKEPDETGTTFRDNARIKAEAAAIATESPLLLTIPALRSMRSMARPEFIQRAGPAPTRILPAPWRRLRISLKSVAQRRQSQRKAHFVSALCVAWPDGHTEEFEARVDGVLVWPPRGDKGFGYDPMFLPDGHRAHLWRNAKRRKAWPAAARQRSLASRACIRETRGGVP